MAMTQREVAVQAYGHNGNERYRDEVIRGVLKHGARVTPHLRTSNDAVYAVNNMQWLYDQADHEV